VEEKFNARLKAKVEKKLDTKVEFVIKDNIDGICNKR